MSEVFEWEVKVPLVANVYIIIDVLLGLLAVSAVVFGVIVYSSGAQTAFDLLQTLLLVDGVLIVVLFFGVGYMFLSRFPLVYRVDQTGAEMRLGVFESSLNEKAWRVSSFLQNHSLLGRNVHTLMRDEVSVTWDMASNVFVDWRYRLITVSNGVQPLIRLYCTRENVETLYAFIREQLPEPEE